MAIDPLTGQEEEQQVIGALPGANQDQMKVLGAQLYEQATKGIQSSGVPGFSDLKFDNTSASTDGWDTRPLNSTSTEETVDSGWDERPLQSVTTDDEYGYGIKNAFMRGIIRGGQLIDLMQGDVEEYAEGEEALKGYGLSEKDMQRMTELQDTDSVMEALGYYITNPALALQVVAESLPLSVPTLGGALAGGLTAGPAGAVAAGATGSGITEYLATIGDALNEAGIDATDPEALKAAFADQEFMLKARTSAVSRGIGVALFDALSIGLAGRIYKPVKALARSATKTGAVVGGTSELLAQGLAGGAGEAAAQLFDEGEVSDKAAVAGEIIGEFVPGVGEIAINKAIGRDAVGNKPDDTAPPTATPEGDVAPVSSGTIPIPPSDDTGAPITEAEAAAIDASTAADIDVDAEAADIVTEPPPETETATTSPEPTAPKAPKAQEEGSSEVVEEVPIEDMLAEAANKEEAAEQASREADTDEVETETSPLIDPKTLGPKITETITTNEKPGPVRAAWRGLMENLAKRYPETAAKVPARTFSGTGVAKFFKVLQEEVDLTKDLPEVKALLDGVAEGTSAEIIQSLDRLSSHVQGTIPSLTDAPIDSIAGQVQAEYNNFMSYYEGAKTQGKGKLTKGKEVLRGTKIKMANKLGELSGAVRALLKAGEDAGVLEQAGIGANYGKTMELADSIADSAQAPIEKKNSSGGKSRTIQYKSSTLLEVAENLRAIAEKVTPLLAEVEAKGTEAKATKTKTTIDESTKKVSPITPKQANTKVKVEPSSPVTEAPAKPLSDVERVIAEFQAAEAIEAAAALNETTDPGAPQGRDFLDAMVGPKNRRKIRERQAKTSAEAATSRIGKTSKAAKGEAAAAISKARNKAKKPKKVKGADPNEVFNPEPVNVVGREAQRLKDEAGADTLDAAMEKIGVSKAALKKLRGIMKAVTPEQSDQITEAAYRHIRKPDAIRLVSDIANIVGKRVGPEVYDTITEFALAISEQRDARIAEMEAEQQSFEDDIASMMSEDDLEIARMTGAIEPDIDVESTATDEYNVPLSKRLYSLFDLLGNKLLDKSRAVSKVDNRILERAFNKLRLQIAGAGTIKTGEFIDMMLGTLPSNHRFSFLLKQIKKSNLDLDVNIVEEDNVTVVDAEGNARSQTGGSFKPDYASPEKSSIRIITNDQRSGRVFFRTATHELLHAVTVFRYATDANFRRRMDALWKKVTLQVLGNSTGFDPAVFEDLTKNNALGAYDYVLEFLRTEPGDVNMASITALYGLTSPKEFVAEAFTNLEFQELLASIKSEPHGNLSYMSVAKSFLKVFLNELKKILGVSLRNTVLEEVLVLGANNFDTAASYSMAAGNVELQRALQLGKLKRPKLNIEVADSVPDKKVRTNVINNAADIARERDSKVKQTYETLVDGLKNLPRSLNLGFMNRDVIERNYRALFARASKAAGHTISPLTTYIKSKQAASQLAEKFAVRATAALQKMQKFDNKTRSEIQALMRDTTLAQVWPHVSLRAKENAHLWTKPDKKGVSKLSPALGEAAKQARKDWLALNKKHPEAAKLLIEMAELTKEIQDRKRIEALQTVGKTYELDESTTIKLGQLETREDIQKMFPGMYDKDGSLLANSVENRPADTLIEKGDSKEVKEQKKEKLNKWRDARNIARTAEEIVKGTSINGPYFPLRRYGKYVVASTDEYNEDNAPYVSFHSTRKEAARVAAALEQKYEMPTYLSKKIESMAISRDVESVAAELASRLEGRKDDHMHTRLKAAMIEVMADNTAYASQLKRAGIDGVAADDMGRAFEEYVFVAKYTLGDLATAYEVTQSLKDLKRLQSKGVQDAIRQGKITEEEGLLIGDVVNELAAQNREDAKDREMSTFQKGVGLIGFFNFLGAPSYWVLNATQTLTVTLPYIGAKWGAAKASVAYGEAAKTILAAAKGAKSYDQFKSNLPAAAQKVVAELEAQGIIQSTIAHQFGDIMTPSTLTNIQDWAGPVGKATATALKLMETIPEGVEKYNRISTALAIYNLSGGNIQAVADGVQATQFNYDSANRARLLKAAPGWAGGGLRAIITPMMMFKSYGIGLTRLLYGSMMDVALKKGGRVEAMKLAGGLITTHTVFGGVAGGLMMAPVQALVSVFNEVFREAGDEWDPDEAVELYLQDVANDTVAALVSRGLPAALGVDMSKSINLGNLLWMGNDRIDLSEAGGVETMMTTALGPVAQYAVTTVREGARLWTGDQKADWYDFLAAAIPLKALRGMIRGTKYEMQGIGTDTLTFVDAEDVTGWLRMAMGFRPTNIAMTTDYEYNLLAREGRQSKRKSQLIDRALRADSASERQAVWEDISQFNTSLDRKDRITRADVIRLKSSRRTRQRQYDRERR